MKINRLHAILGFLLIIVPLLGFTRGFKYGFSIICGGVILYFAMRSIHAEYSKKHKNKKHDSFVENKPKNIPQAKSKEEINATEEVYKPEEPKQVEEVVDASNLTQNE